MSIENNVNRIPEPESRKPDSPVTPQAELEAKFTKPVGERDPSVVVEESQRVEQIKKDILFRASQGVAPEITSLATEGVDRTRDVDNVRLDAIRMVTARKLGEAGTRAKWTAAIGGLVGFSGGVFGGAVATGTTIASATALTAGAAVAALPVGAALLGYGIYKFVKNRSVQKAEREVKAKWG